MLGNPGKVFNTFTNLLQIIDGEINIASLHAVITMPTSMQEI